MEEIGAVKGRKRSRAWVYYSLLTLGSLAATVAGHVAMLVGVLLFGLYARYLHRGGRFVIWFW
jgi:hypothetical protein